MKGLVRIMYNGACQKLLDRILLLYFCFHLICNSFRGTAHPLLIQIGYFPGHLHQSLKKIEIKKIIYHYISKIFDIMV